MKPLPHHPQTTPPERSQALMHARIREVFQRLPLLLGFSLDHDLSVADIELRTWPGYEWSEEAYREIESEISALLAHVDDEVNELLRGRTFARTLH
jgi:hypothetical protein